MRFNQLLNNKYLLKFLKKISFNKYIFRLSLYIVEKLMTHSSKSKLPTKNALLLIDIQEKIISPINNKDSIIKNIQKLLSAYQILDKNIYVSEQNPLKLGKTIPKLLPKLGFTNIQKMDFSLATSKVLFELSLIHI